MKSARKNFHGAHARPYFMDEYLDTEKAQVRISEPSPLNSLSQFHISMFGILSKGTRLGLWGRYSLFKIILGGVIIVFAIKSIAVRTFKFIVSI